MPEPRGGAWKILEGREQQKVEIHAWCELQQKFGMTRGVWVGGGEGICNVDNFSSNRTEENSTLREEICQVYWQEHRDYVAEPSSALNLPEQSFHHPGFLIERMCGLDWAGFGIRQI